MSNPYMGAQDVIVNLEGLRRDMRANAFDYLARAFDGQPIESIAGIINGNGQRYLERIQLWYQANRSVSALSKLMAQGLLIDQSAVPDTVTASPLTPALGQGGVLVDPIIIETPIAVPPEPDDTLANDVLSKYDAFANALLPVAQAEAAAVIATYDDIVAAAQATLAAVPLVV